MCESRKLTVSEFQNKFRSLPSEQVVEAFRVVMEERKLEVEMYWRRTAYFWGLIATALVGYFAAHASKDSPFWAHLLIAFIGLSCSVAWYLTNRGSKYWQENWEHHVALIEDTITGPLHRHILDEHGYSFWRLHNAYPYSVTKINQLLSLYIVLVWCGLVIADALQLDWSLRSGSFVPALVGVLSIAYVFGCITLGARKSQRWAYPALVEKELPSELTIKKSKPMQRVCKSGNDMGDSA